jgi:hypothetical protein
MARTRSLARPAWPVVLNTDSPLYDGLVCLALPEFGVWWHGRWHRWTQGGAAIVVPDGGTGGAAVLTGASADVLSVTGLTPAIPVTGPLTFHVWGTSTVSNTTRKRAFRLAGATVGTIANFDWADGTNNVLSAGLQVGAGTFPVRQTVGAPVAFTTYALTAWHDPAVASITLYINGQLQVAGFDSLTANADRREAITQVFLGNNSSAFPLTGRTGMACAWTRLLSAGEAQALANPQTRWDLLIPAREARRRVYADLGAIPPTGFQAAWASGSNVLLQPGL